MATSLPASGSLVQGHPPGVTSLATLFTHDRPLLLGQLRHSGLLSLLITVRQAATGLKRGPQILPSSSFQEAEGATPAQALSEAGLCSSLSQTEVKVCGFETGERKAPGYTPQSCSQRVFQGKPGHEEVHPAGTWACPQQPGESESLPSRLSVPSGGPEPGPPATMHRHCGL